MIYQFEGREYVESGEERTPERGDIFESVRYTGDPCGATRCIDPQLIQHHINNGIRKILKLKENEYIYPVLVRRYDGFIPAFDKLQGQIIMAKKDADGTFRGPKGLLPSQLDGITLNSSNFIPFPTQKDFEQNQPLRQAPTLPPSILAALAADNSSVCKGAREWTKGLMEAVMAEIEKAKVQK